MKKSKHPKVFIQDTGPYRHEILISIGATREEILAYAKKELTKESYKMARDCVNKTDCLEKIANGDNYGFAVLNGRYIYLFMKPYEDEWGFWENLLHELHHVVGFITELKRLEGEMEAQAYLQEYLFKEIRRKIQGLDPID